MSILKSVKILLVLIVTICGTSAQVESSGKCFQFRPLDDFNDSRNQAVWYEYSRTPRAVENGAKCVRFYIDEIRNGVQQVIQSQVDENTNKKTTEANELQVTGPGTGITARGLNYIYLTDDYDNYAAVYACKYDPDKNIKKEFLWVLTRNRNPPSEVVALAYDEIRKRGVPTHNLKQTNQSGCPKR